MTAHTQSRDARATATLTTLASAFERRRITPGTTVPSWLQPLQDKAFKTFSQAGFPRTKDEDWKYTNLTGFAERSAAYLHNPSAGDAADPVEALLDDLPQTEDGYRIVFVNGLYRVDLSTVVKATAGIELTPYSVADTTGQKRILDDQPIDRNALVALNTAFLTDGLAIHVANKARIDTPIHIVFASDGQPAAAQPRLTIDLGRNAEALVVQHHIGTGESLTNAVTSINCAEHSRMFFVRIQNESAQSLHVASQVVRVAANGHFDGVNIDLGSQMARNDIDVDLHGERAHANLYGLFMANGDRHVDNHLRVDHSAPNTTSREVYRGILNNTARGVFNGKIIVHSGADGTDAQLNNRNLLLSERAEINTKPELEIYTDDVKCAHGSTTGQLDHSAMFYLRARGVPESAARIMLVSAFAREIIDHVRSKSPLLADYLDRRVNRQLPDSA